ncbi:hypothetical protein C7444_1125 [Sphaerotilus hippei]|uniref:Uncharacterized protein n=1 Tax=Sphaerotilus hippei TaxID=744406 RepID=A0A318GXV3_9BURK|nr:hypothetical protein [Sphaerotilus hippei]PXW94690.1 hypothetical protein C7444_1125 [Sphaerotilus hippei]
MPHLLIPHASAASDAGAAALATLKLPVLERLLGQLVAGERSGDDEYTLSLPHEQVLARHHGWQGEDGRWPFAAWRARQDGLEVDDEGWGLVTPCHWLVGSDQISLVDPGALALQADESRTLMDTLRPSFEAEGWQLHWGAPLRWYARHPVLRQLRTASLDRAIGRNLDLWLRGQDPDARRLRRLQVEAQMLWHEHPVNDRREARRALTVNSFWLSGCGAPQPAAEVGLQVDDTLHGPLVAGDWAAWCAAWQALDDGPIRTLLAACERGEPVSLTLSGERVAQRLDRPDDRWMARQVRQWRARWQPPSARALLADL